MNNPLAIFATVWMTAFFAFSWVLLIGHWLGFTGFSYDQYIIGDSAASGLWRRHFIRGFRYGDCRREASPRMRKIFGDLGTMCLGVSAILIAAVIISFGAGEGPQLAPVAGAVVLMAAGIVLRVLGDGSPDGNGRMNNGRAL